MTHTFSTRLRALREERGLSIRALAVRVHYSKSYVDALARGVKQPTVDVARRLDDALGAGGELLALASATATTLVDDEVAAIELARSVTACDVSTGTLDRLGESFDDLASAYTSVPPAELAGRVRAHLGYVAQLMQMRMPLANRRQLLTVGGWLSVLAATVHIDLHQHTAARARLATAATLAEHAEHSEISAWCVEARAWEALTAGDFAGAIELSRQAQSIAPVGSSAHIQATARPTGGVPRKS